MSDEFKEAPPASLALPEHDYVSPGFEIVIPDAAFPNMVPGDTSIPQWRYLRKWIEHNWYTDRRSPDAGFVNRDEASILYNSALLFRGQPCLEIGCWRGWSTVHLAMGCRHLDVVDPLVGKPDWAGGVKASCAAAGVLDWVTFHAGESPEAVDRLAETTRKRWSLIFIDGEHEGQGPLLDARAAMRHAADTALVLFHDLASPLVAAGLDAMRDQGWNTMVYQTMQIMGVAWRGNVKPLHHIPDPNIVWTLPKHLSTYKVSGWEPQSQRAAWWPGMTVEDRRRAATLRAQYAEDQWAAADAQFDSAMAERANALAKRDTALAKRDALQAEYDKALAERDTAFARRDAAEAECDDAMAERDMALAERDAAEAETDDAEFVRYAAEAERDNAMAERDAALTERDAALTERDAANAGRDAAWAALRASAIVVFTDWMSRRLVLASLFRRSTVQRRSAFLAKAAALQLDSRVAEAAVPTLCRRRVLFGLARRTLARRTMLISQLLEDLARQNCEATSFAAPAYAASKDRKPRPVRVVKPAPGLAEHASPVVERARPRRQNVIIVVHEASRTGAPILGWNIAQQLAERYNIFTVCLGDGALIPEFKALSAAFYGPFPGLLGDPVALEKELKPLFAGRNFRYAIINSCESRSLVGICKKHGVPTLFLMHEFASYVYYRAALEDALRGADKIVFPADIVAESSRQVYPDLAPQSMRILPQGMCTIPASNGTQKPLSPALLERLSALRATGGLIVLGAGSVQMRKGVDLFLATASKVCRNGLNRSVHFVWVGAGYRPDEDMAYSIYLREQLQRSEIEGCVSFVDEVSDLDLVYDLTDMFFLASRLDPLPNVTIDAAYRGIPVVCFKGASGMSELMLSDPVAAEVVVDYLDADAAAQCITRLADDEASRIRISQAVRRLALGTFDMKRYVHQLDALGRAEHPSAHSARCAGARA